MIEARIPITAIFSLLYSVLIATHLLGNTFNFSPATYVFISILSLMVILAVNLKKFKKLIRIFYKKLYLKFYIIIFLIWTICINSIGAFDIVPSDFLQHLSAVRFALIELNHWDYFKFIGSWYSDKGNHYGYMPQALLAFLFNSKPSDLLFFWNWFNPLILLLALFELNLNILRICKVDSKILGWVSFLSVLSFPFMFGVDSFSYIRAYSIAAALPGFVLFIYVLNMTISLMKNRYIFIDLLKKVSLIIFVIAVQFLNHPQEALFSITFLITLIIYYLVKYIYMRYLHLIILGSDFDTVCFKVIMVYSTLLIGFLVAGQIGNEIGIFAFNFFNIWIYNPLDLLLRVYGVWGTVILAVSIFSLRDPSMEKPIYILVLNLFLFVFNPLFQTVVAKFYQEAIIYRFVFVAPISIFFGLVLSQLVSYVRNRFFKFRRSLGFLFSSFIFSLVVWTSEKRLSLGPLQSTERASFWHDLSQYFASNVPEFKQVFSDPVTGYVLNAYTRQQFYGDKFYSRGRFVPLNISEFSGRNLQIRRGGFLVVNLRNGYFGEFGRENGHWPDTILDVSSNYTLEFLDFVKMSPEIFRVSWRSSDGLITVYSIEG